MRLFTSATLLASTALPLRANALISTKILSTSQNKLHVNQRSPPAHIIHHLAMASSSSSNSQPTSTKRFPPSRVAVDPETNEKWRLCVAAAVLRPSDNALLIGERFGVPGSWQCPQGGVDDKDPESDDEKRRSKAETLREAAARELYEEMGLKLGEHVNYVYGDQVDISDEANVGPAPFRYTTKGTGSWLEKQGFAGQELHWVLFECISEECAKDPNAVCDLNGLNGERQEFTDVKWSDVKTAVADVWENKRAPYESLAEFLSEQEGR